MSLLTKTQTLFSFLIGENISKSRRRKNHPVTTPALVEVQQLEARQLLSNISFVFNYKYDRSRFFNTSAKRAALTLAGKMLTQNIYDGLQSISPTSRNTWRPKITDPGTGRSRTLSSRTKVGTNKIIVYMGARRRSGSNLATAYGGGWSARGSNAWLKRVRARGESGALRSSPTDFGPWGGSISFNSNQRWHFGKTTIGLDADESDFVSVAMHELGHILGINSGNRSWSRLIDSSRRFRGSKSVAEFGGRVPIHSSRGHFDSGVSNQGREVAMDPNISDGTRKFFTKLDFAALDDIGWTIGSNNDTIYRAKNVLPRTSGSTSTRITGTISNSRDVDIFRVYATDNTTINVSAFRRPGTKAVDTFLKLYNASGSRILSRDQGGTGGTDTIAYTTTREGYFYVAVSSYRNRNFKPFVDNSGSAGTTGGYLMDISFTGGGSLQAPAALASSSLLATASNSDNSNANYGTFVVQPTAAPPQFVVSTALNNSANSRAAGTPAPQVAPENNIPSDLIDHVFANSLKNPLLLVN